MKHITYNRNTPRYEIADIWPNQVAAANKVSFDDYGKALSFALGMKRLYPHVRMYLRDKLTRRVVPIGR